MKEKILFSLFVISVLIAAGYFALRPNIAPEPEPTPVWQPTLLPTIPPPDYLATPGLDAGRTDIGCGSEPVYTSLPAKCLDASGHFRRAGGQPPVVIWMDGTPQPLP